MWSRHDASASVRPFYLHRIVDASGVSGTGIVAVGAVLPSGKAILEWRSRWKTVTVFESVDQIVLIHGHGGRTQLHWGDPPAEPRLPAWVQAWQALTAVRAPATAPPRLTALPRPPSGDPAPASESRAKDLYAALRTHLVESVQRLG